MDVAQKTAKKILKGEFGSLVSGVIDYFHGEAKYHTIGRRDSKRLKRTQPSLAAAISKTISNEIESDDRETIGEIENIRQRLNSSNKAVELNYNIDDPDELDVEIGDHIEGQIDLAQASKSQPLFCLLLYHIVRETKADQCLELGTSIGISGSYLATGIRQHGGKLTTIEGAPDIAQIAQQHFNELGFDNVTVINGLFQNVLDEALPERTFDFVYIDANHTYEATIQYFDWIYPHLESGAIVVFDDIYWSDGMERAWETIQDDNRISIAVDTGWHGICVVGDQPRSDLYQIPIRHKTVTN